MDNNKYKKIVDNNTPKEDRLKNGMRAFLVGGLMGLIGELLIEIYSYIFSIPTPEAAMLMITTLIFLGCLFTGLGFFDKIVTFAKAGLIIPITGFAHAMMSSTFEYKREGLITGVGANMFKLAGSVVIFGVVSAYVVGLIRFIVFGG